jgi:hypothetical protein
MKEAMSLYGITDENLIKPGIGEATRVLLRRFPQRVIVRDCHDLKVATSWRLPRRRPFQSKPTPLCPTAPFRSSGAPVMRDATELGASLYLPATRLDLLDVVRGERLSEVRSVIFCTEDSVRLKTSVSQSTICVRPFVRSHLRHTRCASFGCATRK